MVVCVHFVVLGWDSFDGNWTELKLPFTACLWVRLTSQKLFQDTKPVEIRTKFGVIYICKKTLQFPNITEAGHDKLPKKTQ